YDGLLVPVYLAYIWVSCDVDVPEELAAPAALLTTELAAPCMSARFAAKLSRILPPTSEIMPLQNWAGLPVTLRSVATAPLVDPPSAVSVTVTVAAAVPAPRASLP